MNHKYLSNPQLYHKHRIQRYLVLARLLRKSELLKINVKVGWGLCTLGRPAMYDSGISISERMLLLIAMAALWIWLELSRLCLKCFLDFSERPLGGAHGTGTHHFSSFRCTLILRNDPDADADAELVDFDEILPCSAYQNSVSWKLSSTSCPKHKIHVLQALTKTLLLKNVRFLSTWI